MRLRQQHRSGTTVVECAIVFPPTLLLIIGLVVAGLGVFRYQEVSSLARRAARYASVRGKQYARETGNPAATPDSIYNNAIKPYAFSLDLSKLNYSVTYNAENAPTTAFIQNDKVVTRGNTVTVTASYTWIPEAFIRGTGITLTSTSVLPMSY
jgi:Flp pilus assembly protein TadG